MSAAIAISIDQLNERHVDVSEHAGNAFGIYPKTGWRTTSIILMIGHQAVAFMLFVRISSHELCWQFSSFIFSTCPKPYVTYTHFNYILM